MAWFPADPSVGNGPGPMSALLSGKNLSRPVRHERSVPGVPIDLPARGRILSRRDVHELPHQQRPADEQLLPRARPVARMGPGSHRRRELLALLAVCTGGISLFAD